MWPRTCSSLLNLHWLNRYLIIVYMLCVHIRVLVMYKQPIVGLTQVWSRELSFSRLECGVHDNYTFPVQTGAIFYFPWHIYHIEGTKGYSVSSERHRDTHEPGFYT